MGVKDYDLNPDNNTQINGINIAEGCPPSGINNAIRQLMADVKADSDAQNEKASTPASGSNLGPVKIGDGLSIGEDGTLSLDLVDAVDSSSTTKAPTAKAVKMAYDKVVAIENAIAKAFSVTDFCISFTNSKEGYLLCNGAAVSRTTYAALFAKIGTNFGAGDGSKTFNLPDFRDRTFWGANSNLMSVIEAGLPNIAGRIPVLTYRSTPTVTGPFGNFSLAQYSMEGAGNAPTYGMELDFDAKKANAVYGKSKTVQPSAIGVNILIKY